jgi:hypothetical protein
MHVSGVERYQRPKRLTMDTSGFPEKCTPEFLKKYPDGIPAKKLCDALQEGATASASETPSTPQSDPKRSQDD